MLFQVITVFVLHFLFSSAGLLDMAIKPQCQKGWRDQATALRLEDPDPSLSTAIPSDIVILGICFFFLWWTEVGWIDPQHGLGNRQTFRFLPMLSFQDHWYHLPGTLSLVAETSRCYVCSIFSSFNTVITKGSSEVLRGKLKLGIKKQKSPCV